MQPKSLGDVARARLARRFGTSNGNNPWKPKRDPGFSVGAVKGKSPASPNLRGIDRVLTPEEAQSLFGFKDKN